MDYNLIEQDRRFVMARNIHKRIRDSDLSIAEQSTRLGIDRSIMWRHTTGRQTPSIGLLNVYSSFFQNHMIELILSGEEMRDMLFELICKYDVRVSDPMRIDKVPFYDYETVISRNISSRRQRKKMTKRVLADRSGWSISCGIITRCEKGGSLNPLLVVPMAFGLEVTPLELLTPPEHLPDVIGFLAWKYRVLDEIGKGIT